MKRRRFSKKAWLGIVSVLVVSGVVAAIVLFSQTSPPVPASNMSSGCATLTPSSTLVLQGGSGVLVFSCNSNAAFNVVAPSASTPTYDTPQGYTSMWAVRHGFAVPSTCSAGAGAIQLSSGSAVNWGNSDAYDYCRDYAGVPPGGLATWTVSWST